MIKQSAIEVRMSKLNISSKSPLKAFDMQLLHSVRRIGTAETGPPCRILHSWKKNGGPLRGRHFLGLSVTAQGLSELPSSAIAITPPITAAPARTPTTTPGASLFDFFDELEALTLDAFAIESGAAVFANTGVVTSDETATAANSLLIRIN
ncbi:hypothetical protein [Novosphingobium beihaiensis]|uniref:Uncharacterized protein n=1 Tax=Novosphingobium beihaiensis TaxID=2930389 RepID=A0ABT0BVY6_9SPHN|nr:hypothetical protein [Novosphingobium beihaiensis]MCJ2189199.1 hypothetical protein [Novosphingobium beihaiensis]